MANLGYKRTTMTRISSQVAFLMGNSDGRHLLILDLDETLIHAAREPGTRAPDFAVGPYSVYKRPYLGSFFNLCANHFTLAVWTSSSADYAQEVLRHIKPEDVHFEFVWARKRCVQRYNREVDGFVFIKDLKKVKSRGYSLEKIIVVDDSPEKLARQYGNLVRVRPYLGADEDDELYLLGKYLLTLREVENIRRVEKRGWRSQMERGAIGN